MEKYITETELRKQLELSHTHICKIVKAGCPGLEKGKGFPLYAVCKWVVGRPKRRADKTKSRENASRILDGIKPSSVTVKGGTTKITSKHIATKKEALGELGLEAALSRIKAMEQRLHGQLIDTIDSKGFDVAPKLKSWQDSCELLRKTEGDCLKVLEEQKRLMDVDQVKSWLSKKLETAKAYLLNLPAKVAPGLDGLPWHEIQKRLEVEVRNALTKLSASDLT